MSGNGNRRGLEGHPAGGGVGTAGGLRSAERLSSRRRRRPLRIAEVAPPWLAVPPQGYGGIELVVDLLVRGLHERGHEVTLFAPEGSESPARVVSPLPPVGAAAIGDRWAEAVHALTAFRHAREFDVLHDHTLVGAALAAAHPGGPAVLHTLHGPWDGLAAAYYGLVHDRVHLVAISDAQRRANRAIRYAGTVPNGIELARYPLQDGSRDDFLVYIGRATRDKAPELAVELAHRAGLPLKLLVKRAEPAERRYWDECVAPLLGPDDDALEDVTHEQKVELLRRGRAFVFPIRWEEPFGLVMVEALACGMPVVATPRGAAVDIVEDGVTGFLAPDLDGLAAALRRIDRISPHDCRARVVERFSAEAMVDGYERLLYELVASPAARAVGADASVAARPTP